MPSLRQPTWHLPSTAELPVKRLRRQHETPPLRCSIPHAQVHFSFPFYHPILRARQVRLDAVRIFT